MGRMTWVDAYSVGIRTIDEQHKKLIALINKLDDAMAKGHGKEAVGDILNELITYCGTHFGNEERLFDKHGYPDAESHKEKHKKMTAKVLDVQRQYKAGKMNITFEVMDFLQNWLDKHILGTDKKYAPFLQSKGEM